MDFFCPHCRQNHNAKNLSICLDPNNEILTTYAAAELVGEKAASGGATVYISVITENLRNLYESAGFKVISPDMGGESVIDYELLVNSDYIIEELESVWTTIKDAHSQNRISALDDDLIEQVDNFIECLTTNDYSDFEEKIKIKIHANKDKTSGELVLHNAIRLDTMAVLPKVCSSCHHITHEDAGEHEEVLIALLGTPRVSKTSCIASTLYGFMLNDNANGLYRDDVSRNDVHITFGAKKDEGSIWHNNVIKPLLDGYSKGWAVEKSEETTPFFEYYITVKLEIPNAQSGAEKEHILLSFVDMPGEFINSDDGLSEEFLYKYEGAFSAAHAFWFCTDLVQLERSKNPDFLNYMGYGGVDMAKGESESAAVKSLLKNVVGITKLDHNLSVIKSRYFQHRDFPATAIILAKSDGAKLSTLWSGDVPAFIYTDGESGKDFKGENDVYKNRQKSLLLDKFCHLSSQIRNTLFYINRPNKDEDDPTPISDYIEGLENHFKKRAYFSISAYSRKAIHKPADAASDDEFPERRPQPYRTRLPLYWTLAVLGKLDVSVTAYKEEGRIAKKITEIKNHIVRSGDTYMDEDKTEISVVDKLCRFGGEK